MKLATGNKLVLLLFLLGLFPIYAETFEKPVLHIEYKDSVSVSSAQITFGDIAEIKGEGSIVSELQGTIVGRSANFGLIRYLDTRTLYVRHLAPLAKEFEVKGDLEKIIKIETESDFLDKETLVLKIRNLIKDLIPKMSSDFQFEFDHIPNLVRVPTRLYALSIKSPRAFVPEGRQNITLQISVNDTVVRNIPLGIYFRVYDSVWVAKERISRGTILNSDHIQKEYREVTRLSGTPVKEEKNLIGKKAKQSISSNRILTSKLVAQKPIIELGQAVKVKMERKGIYIEVDGVARQNGIRGQIIHVKNLVSNQLMRAKIIDKNTLEWVGNNSRG